MILGHDIFGQLLPHHPLQWKWIPSHTNIVYLSHQLNSITDTLAKYYRTTSIIDPCWPPWTHTPFFCQINGHNDHGLPTLQHPHHPATIALHNFLKQKWKWNDKQLQSIEWQSYSKVLKSAPHHQRKFWRKAKIGWLHTNQRQSYYTSKEPICQSCNKIPETQEHICICAQNIQPELIE